VVITAAVVAAAAIIGYMIWRAVEEMEPAWCVKPLDKPPAGQEDQWVQVGTGPYAGKFAPRGTAVVTSGFGRGCCVEEALHKGGTTLLDPLQHDADTSRPKP